MIIAAPPRRQARASPQDRSLDISETFLKARYVALAAALAVFAAVLFGPRVLYDGDTYMHIAAGRWMLENRAVLRIDPFSYTFAGHPWLTHEWLSQVMMALVYLGGGWSGLILFFASAAAVAAAVFALYLSRWLQGTALAAAVILSLCALTNVFLVRPHILAWPLLVIWVAELVIAAEKGRQPPLWLLPVMSLWANLHASFAFGLVFIVVVAAEDAIAHGSLRKAARNWGLFAVLSVAAALVTPHGLDGLLFPFKMIDMRQLYFIEEWRPLDLGLTQPPVLVLGFAMFVLMWRGVAVTPVRLLTFLGLVFLTLAHVRYVMELAMVGPLILAKPLADSLGTMPSATRPAGLRPQLGFAVAFALLAALRLALPVVRGDGPATPASAMAHVPAALARLPVLNEYSFGGYLIFHNLRPFIDGRAELYGGKFLDTYVHMVEGDQKTITAVLAKYRVRWTILSPENKAAAVMDQLKGWHRLYADKWAVVHVKDGAP